ncbi:MAG: hypothetical protein A2Z51_01705 [Deltaproteobacteria bacterium RBG_19FT_COMBO_52_11]|nr:MAG: hypothetical protein A2Z51_01705 [Deltaproteobacteria bacterium RBG_19FT_COMBO_52_11]
MKQYRLPLMPVIWGFTCLIIGVLVAMGFLGYKSAEKAIASQFNDQQLMLANQAARGIEDFLADICETATLLTRTPEIQKHPGQIEKQNLQTIHESFKNKVNFLFLVDSRGIITAFYPPGEAKRIRGSDENSQPYFQKARSTGRPVVYSANPLSEGSQRLTLIRIAVPIVRGSEFIGVLGFGLDFGKVNERYIHPIRSGATGGAWMINHEGKFIAHYDPDFLGKDAFLARKERNPDFSFERINRIVKEEMLQGKAGIDEYISDWHRGERGRIKKLIAYAPVKIDDQIWSIAVVAPYSDVTRVVWGSFKNSVLLLAVMACTLLAGTYVGHKINQGRIRAEEKVRWGEEVMKSQSRLQTLFDGSPEAIIIVDRNFKVSMVNKTALNWYNQTLKEFSGKFCYQVFQGRSDLCRNCPAQESFQTGQPAHREKASLVADGTKRSLQLFTFPLRDRRGEVIEVVEYVKDVTAEKMLQQQIIQSERLAIVGRMSANVAHEIKNPMGTIMLNAELLEEELNRFSGQDTTEARSLLGVIKAELDHLIHVIEEYLQFARLPKVKLERGSVNQVISDLLLFLREETCGRKLVVVEELEAALPEVHLDAQQFRRALLNIIKNSFEAMDEGGKLSVSTASRDGRVEVTIADTGKGIPEENLESIFTPFFSTKQGGTGLGLSITSHIVKEHRGTVGFKSYPNLGTAFRICLPALSSTSPVLLEKESIQEQPANERGGPWSI